MIKLFFANANLSQIANVSPICATLRAVQNGFLQVSAQREIADTSALDFGDAAPAATDRA
jgi:hypothetical protein